MRRLTLCLAVAVAALVTAPAALADGPPPLVTSGGGGVATRDGAFHYVAVPDGSRRTLLEKVEVSNSQLNWWIPLEGSWGTPQLAYGESTGQGLSWDGRTLVLSSLSGPYASPSKFLIVNLKQFRVVRTITLRGSFSFDALSPDASRLYLIQYTRAQTGNLSHYIVRGYDLRTNRLLPGRIADRTQKGWVMKGSPLTRTWSAYGRWVYTLYENPGGYPFIHALDTRRGVAHCIQLPWEEDRSQAPLYNLVLDASNDGRALAVHRKNGSPWMRIAVGGWQVSEARSAFPWAWVGAGIGGGLAIIAAAGAALLLRRRRREELDQHHGQELGLA
jgi:hypothetical protein